VGATGRIDPPPRAAVVDIGSFVHAEVGVCCETAGRKVPSFPPVALQPAGADPTRADMKLRDDPSGEAANAAVTDPLAVITKNAASRTIIFRALFVRKLSSK